jgi:hypothetical protein
MGGRGSGSWYRWNKKDTVDDGLSLDINKLVRDGLIVRGYGAGLHEVDKHEDRRGNGFHWVHT